LYKTSLLLLWLALLIQILEEWFKFDYVCINFLNKTSGQTWYLKNQTTYNLERREYVIADGQIGKQNVEQEIVG